MVAAAVVAAVLLTAALVTAAVVPAALVTTALVTAAVFTSALVAAALVAAARGLLVTAGIPAPPVIALGFAGRGFARLAVFPYTLRRTTCLGRSLLGRCWLGCPLLTGGLLGLAVRPVGHGLVIEAELLPGCVRTDTTVRSVAEA